MRVFLRICGIGILLGGWFLTVWACANETIEMSTYIPTPGTGQGRLVDHVYAEKVGLMTLNAPMPIDNGGNGPSSQINYSQGTEILRATITPKATTSRLLVRVTAPFATAGGGTGVLALFRDATGTDNAKAVSSVSPTGDSANYNQEVSVTYETDAVTTNATTFVVKMGSNSGTITIYLNGRKHGTSGEALLNHRATLTIDEISQ